MHAQLAALFSLKTSPLPMSPFTVLDTTVRRRGALRHLHRVAQFTCEFFVLLFGEHKFVANESTTLSTDVN
jgi:hypothetical protein